MAFTTDLNAVDNPTAGSTAPAGWGDALNANAAALGGAWTAYNPAWTAPTNPAIGNGTLTGKYRKIGKTLDFRIEMEAGSTTTFGSGIWSVSLPSGITTASAGRQTCTAFGADASSGQRYGGAAVLVAAGATATSIALGAGSSATSAVPFTWDSGDYLIIEGTIEVA